MNQIVFEPEPTPPLARALVPQRHNFTVDVVRKMADAGLLGETRVELVDGEIYDMPEEGAAHQDLRDRIVAWFYRALIPIDPTIFVSTNGPLRMSQRNSPEPDVYLRPGGVPLAELTPVQVFLGIELTFTTQNHDFKVKTPVYARSGLRELWIVDGPSRRTVVHRAPSPEGHWDEVAKVAADEAISPLAFPELSFRLADHLPPELENV